MNGRGIESRLIQASDFSYDQSGNPYVSESIGDVEIVNVPESFRFIRPETLAEPQREQILNLLSDALPHPRTDNDDLEEGAYFASCLSKGSIRSSIPAEFLVGSIIKDKERLAVTGNLIVSFHGAEEQSGPKFIGF